MSVARIKNMPGADHNWPIAVDRCEFLNTWAVHFRLLDFLGGGTASSTRIDTLGKGVVEYIRSQFTDVPAKYPA